MSKDCPVTPTLGQRILVTKILWKTFEEVPNATQVTWETEHLLKPFLAWVVDITHRQNGIIETEIEEHWPANIIIKTFKQKKRVPCLIVRERAGRAAYEVPMDGWSPL